MATLPPLANNDILLYTIWGKLNDQRIMTTFHYKVTNYIGTSEPYDATLTRFLAYQSGGDGVFTKMLPLLPANYESEKHSVQPIYPTRRRYLASLLGDFGGYATGSNTQNIALSIKRLAVTPTRQGVGRVQLPIADALISQGIISLVTITAELAAFEEAALAAFVPTDSPCQFDPVLFGKDANGNYTNSPVWTMQAYPEARTMHRRTVGLGI